MNKEENKKKKRKLSTKAVEIKKEEKIVEVKKESPEEVEKVLKEGLACDRAVIMDFRVEPEECVYPMVPAGAPISKMLLV